MGEIIYNPYRPWIMFDQDGTLNQWRWIDVSIVATPGYFRTVEPHKQVIGAAKILNMLGNNVGTYGAVWQDGHSQNDKDWWMDRNVIFIDRGRRFYVPCGTEKASFFYELIGRPITRADILVDDCSDVLRSWESYGGTAVKVRTPENGSKGTWRGPSFYVDAPADEIAMYLLMVQRMAARGVAANM